MAIRARIDPIAQDVQVILNGDLSPDAQSRAMASFARERLGEAQEANKRVLGRVPPHTTHVDGRLNAPLDSVRPKGGVIVFEFDLVVDVLHWIAVVLVQRSPRVSGEYIGGHTLFADGREVEPAGAIPFAGEYTFTNTVPYARKIEIGKTSAGRPFVIQVENRIYERTARDARARFGNIAKITFTYRGIVGGYQLRGREGNRSDVRYPTIIVTPN